MSGPVNGRSVVVIGLDGAEPALVFGPFRRHLPTIDGLMRSGSWGRLESTIPAITVPAWASMLSGRDPGELGIYGFRNRVDHSYERLAIADARSVRFPRVWDIVGGAGGRVAVVRVPQTYPVSPVNGQLVSCFLTPGPDSRFAYPLGLKADINEWIEGPLLVDVPDFRSEDKERIRDDIYRMAAQHYEICRRLLVSERHDLFIAVDMGIDRAHHAFWHYMDEGHPRYEPGHPLATAILDYYVHVDGQLASLLALVPDDAVILVVSDHGGQAMQGGLCVNEWMIERDLLALLEYPDQVTRLDDCRIDWSRTRVWGEGGYYGRVFLNVAGREPHGRIAPDHYEAARDELAAALCAVAGPDGRPIGSSVYKPEDIYVAVRGIPPDLIAYFGDLTWRSVGSLGYRSSWTFENDTGPDDANHSRYGIFIHLDPLRPAGGVELPDRSIYDIAPTLLALLGLPAPAELRGSVMTDL
jgi:predicted AlkP superfamily phosphohydrolase/phosphomutase